MITLVEITAAAVPSVTGLPKVTLKEGVIA